jgi:hypothetical protein
MHGRCPSGWVLPRPLAPSTGRGAVTTRAETDDRKSETCSSVVKLFSLVNLTMTLFHYKSRSYRQR